MEKLERPYIFYLRTPSEYLHKQSNTWKTNAIPVGTVAVKSDENGNLVAAVALCSRLDCFSKDIGRKITLGRLHNYRDNTPGIVASKDPNGLVQELILEIEHMICHRENSSNGYDNLSHIDIEEIEPSLDIIEDMLNRRLGLEREGQASEEDL